MYKARAVSRFAPHIALLVLASGLPFAHSGRSNHSAAAQGFDAGAVAAQVPGSDVDAGLARELVGMPVAEYDSFIELFDEELRVRGDCAVDKGDNCVTDEDVIRTFESMAHVDAPPPVSLGLTPGAHPEIAPPSGGGSLGFAASTRLGGGLPIPLWIDGGGGGGGGGGGEPEPPGSAVPEPSAFLVFSLGLLGVRGNLKRPRH